MNTHRPLLWMAGSAGLLATGALFTPAQAADAPASAVDTSQWTCSLCTFDTGVSGSVEAGLAATSQASARFGDYTGLDRKGASLMAGGEARYRSAEGRYADAEASDLGLRSRRLRLVGGEEGRYRLSLTYTGIPHSVSDSGATPFLGVGSDSLTLPAGYPASSTTGLPLATTLQPVDLGVRRSRWDLGASLLPDLAGLGLDTRISLRHEVKDGTQRLGGAFFATAAQLVAPVDQVTDQLEVSTSLQRGPWQGSLSYLAAFFRNGQDTLSWTNPLSSGTVSAAQGQIALAPDNQFHQLQGQLALSLSPATRLSGDLAIGRMTQDSAYAPATVNTTLAPVTLPANSLNGQVNTLGANLRLSTQASAQLRLHASASRDERDNRSTSLLYPVIVTDMFSGTARSNQPYSYTRDRLRLGGDWRSTGSLKLSSGVDVDRLARTLQEVRSTREATVWAKGGLQAMDNLGLSLKLSHADRRSSSYAPVAWIDPADNPLLRKYNLADRRRDSGLLRADLGLGEGIALGLEAGASVEDYQHSTIGLLGGGSTSAGADLSAAISDQTQLHAFVQTERLRSRQAGSQSYSVADWWSRSKDGNDVLGLGITHSLMKSKLVLGADLAMTRTRSDLSVDDGTGAPAFPRASSQLDSLKLHATYKLQEQLSLRGGFWYERYSSRDWRYDGVLPDTLGNVLLLGEQAPRYHVAVISVSMRYGF
jgi:MtrB/PioB family decaheme-associated outer membrane protein